MYPLTHAQTLTHASSPNLATHHDHGAHLQSHPRPAGNGRRTCLRARTRRSEERPIAQSLRQTRSTYSHTHRLILSLFSRMAGHSSSRHATKRSSKSRCSLPVGHLVLSRLSPPPPAVMARPCSAACARAHIPRCESAWWASGYSVHFSLVV